MTNGFSERVHTCCVFTRIPFLLYRFTRVACNTLKNEQLQYMDYLPLATNNLRALLDAGVGACVYCLEVFNPSPHNLVITDASTVLCPFCSVDAVVPGSHTAEQLNAWHNAGFG